MGVTRGTASLDQLADSEAAYRPMPRTPESSDWVDHCRERVAGLCLGRSTRSAWARMCPTAPQVLFPANIPSVATLRRLSALPVHPIMPRVVRVAPMVALVERVPAECETP